MKRIRWVFILLALGLTLPLLLLYFKAKQSLSMEREWRHRAVAERVVDEMERELSGWLRREEDRPYAHYRFSFVPEDISGEILPLTRSPLAEPPVEPFVVGYFQLDPDGQVRSPLWPRNEELARDSLDWQPTPNIESKVLEVKQVVEAFWQASPTQLADERAVKDAPPPVEEQQAGTTRLLSKKKESLKQNAVAAQADPDEDPPELRLLESLNRGAQQRQERPDKLEYSQAVNVYNFSQRDDNASLRSSRWQSDAASQLQVTEELEADIEQTLEASALERVNVRLEPMIGRPTTDGRLLLYRTVLIGQQAYRQGVVVDSAALRDWLSKRVFSDPQLAAQARLLPPSAALPAGDGYAYLHRFDEPFGSLAAVLALARLPEPPGTLYLYALAALLALATTVGLFALYRMVMVTVGFAERRNNFVSAVTHELKTPLTAIRMYGEMLRDGVVPSEAKRQRYYEIMTAESERLTRLVQNVLELSNLEQKRPLQLISGDVSEVLHEVVGMLQPHVEKEGFDLQLEVEANLPRVRFDRDALIQVLFNLLDNALKYGRQASDKTIILRARRQADGVVLEVADRGPGVASEHLKKIFEPFYRGENELTRKSKGTGIGLALVRGLVERMDGTVTGRNLNAGGFEVSLFLPKPGS